jgi:predicted NodU family carbamoyl transferase
MKKNKNDVYVLGTGLSHDGSACLLKNGKIRIAIEKERITRNKHDGGNDLLAINYCLAEVGITIHDVDLVVQNANFGMFKNGNSFHSGPRLFDASVDLPVVSISHHLAHAYYALGTSPFEETGVLVIDGCGSSYDDCTDLCDSTVVPEVMDQEIRHLYSEKDSFYLYSDHEFKCVYKDISPMGHYLKGYTMHTNTTLHSIGGFYHGATTYCFGNDLEVGKLMGLAPYGRPGIFNHPIFELRDGRVFVNYGDWLYDFRSPVRDKNDLWKNFQYYADIAYWVQKETERAVEYVMRERRKLVNTDNLAYSGGVALNAVANGKLLKKPIFKNTYFTPAAGDNGIAIGCAYYGWLEILKRERVFHDGNSCFGKVYPAEKIAADIDAFLLPDETNHRMFIDLFFKNLPFYLNKEAEKRDSYHIEFSIEGTGIYFVAISNGVITVSDIRHSKPDCVLYADAGTFIQALNDNTVIGLSVGNRSSVLHGDIEYFIGAVQIGELSRFVTNLVKKHPEIKFAKFEKDKDFIRTTARFLAEGKVVAWFQDGCEFGPRALGNRSILADPRKPGIQKFINNKIKFREDFRPFAPVIMREHVSEYFHFCGDSPYMIVVAPIVEEWKDKVAGVVHVDNSCRIQTVTVQSNPKLYELLREFKSFTDLPMLLNTSFNKRGMPIIETPSQALAYFFECGLDCLVMNDYVIQK